MGAPYKRHKLRAHDLGVNRHNKTVAHERERLVEAHLLRDVDPHLAEQAAGAALRVVAAWLREQADKPTWGMGQRAALLTVAAEAQP